MLKFGGREVGFVAMTPLKSAQAFRENTLRVVEPRTNGKRAAIEANQRNSRRENLAEEFVSLRLVVWVDEAMSNVSLGGIS
jgi:hypothetical protein